MGVFLRGTDAQVQQQHVRRVLEQQWLKFLPVGGSGNNFNLGCTAKSISISVNNTLMVVENCNANFFCWHGFSGTDLIRTAKRVCRFVRQCIFKIQYKYL